MGAVVPISPIFGLGGPSQYGPSASGPVMDPVAHDARRDMGRVISLPLPEVYPIPDAHIFNVEAHVASPGASVNTVIPGATIEIPAANLGILNTFTIYVQNMLATTSISWTLLANNNPVPGYNNLTIFPGASPRISNTFDAPVRFVGDVILTVIFSNLDGGAYVIGAALSGWFWPVTADLRWLSAGPTDR